MENHIWSWLFMDLVPTDSNFILPLLFGLTSCHISCCFIFCPSKKNVGIWLGLVTTDSWLYHNCDWWYGNMVMYYQRIFSSVSYDTKFMTSLYRLNCIFISHPRTKYPQQKFLIIFYIDRHWLYSVKLIPDCIIAQILCCILYFEALNLC